MAEWFRWPMRARKSQFLLCAGAVAAAIGGGALIGSLGTAGAASSTTPTTPTTRTAPPADNDAPGRSGDHRGPCPDHPGHSGGAQSGSTTTAPQSGSDV
jgi:hypothetical protein